MSTPTKIVLSAQALGLLYAMHKKSHVTSVVTGMTIVGVVLGEWQAQSADAARQKAVGVTSISSLSQLGRLGRAG